MMREKERGRRNKTERARKWREWALMIRFDSERTPIKSRVWAGVDMDDERSNSNSNSNSRQGSRKRGEGEEEGAFGLLKWVM